MKKIFGNITPVFVVTSIGLILCLSEILILLYTNDNTEATALLGILAIFLCILFFVDRFLVKRLKHRNLVIVEIVFLLFIPLVYVYINRDTEITIDTSKQYLILKYDDKGLRKDQIPSQGFFNYGCVKERVMK